jgi:hypothetical protein
MNFEQQFDGFIEEAENNHDMAEPSWKIISVQESVGTVLAHDITEIRPEEFKGPAFRRGHIIREQDICHLQRLGKEHLFILEVKEDEMHEDDAAVSLANALMSEGVRAKGSPKEGKITIIAKQDGLLKINKNGLLRVNMLGDVMCATLHDSTIVKKGQTVAGTRAIPLVIKKSSVEQAVDICRETRGVISVKNIRKPKAGIVITGNEVYNGLITDAFAPIIEKKIKSLNGDIVGIYYAPDDEVVIEARLRDLISRGADLLITTGGMSVDPDDKTRFAIRRLGAKEITYGSAVLPGAMFLVAYLKNDRKTCSTLSEGIPILGIPACGMYARITIFDIILPRILAGERIGRKELAELGHGGLCMKCDVCSFPACPFGKG